MPHYLRLRTAHVHQEDGSNSLRAVLLPRAVPQTHPAAWREGQAPARPTWGCRCRANHVCLRLEETERPLDDRVLSPGPKLCSSAVPLWESRCCGMAGLGSIQSPDIPEKPQLMWSKSPLLSVGLRQSNFPLGVWCFSAHAAVKSASGRAMRSGQEPSPPPREPAGGVPHRCSLICLGCANFQLMNNCLR